MLARVIAYTLIGLGLFAWYRRQSSMELADRNGVATLPVEPLRGPDRVAAARSARGMAIAQRCEDAGLAYPPREIFLRVFKREAEFEAWGREDDGDFRQIGVFQITMSSGSPGPKRREGDLQVPEGCYRITAFNAESRFHLSLGLDYPNASDKILSDPVKPGYDIYIHGGAASVGCVPLGNDAIEEIFLLATDVKARGQEDISVHVFPARMEGKPWNDLQAAYPEYVPFWRQLEPIYTAFQQKGQVPNVEVGSRGEYLLK